MLQGKKCTRERKPHEDTVVAMSMRKPIVMKLLVIRRVGEPEVANMRVEEDEADVVTERTEAMDAEEAGSMPMPLLQQLLRRMKGLVLPLLMQNIQSYLGYLLSGT